MEKNLNYYNTKIALIKNYFKHDKNFLELMLLNYNSYNIYIRIDYITKLGSYKLSWFDLDLILDNKIAKYLSSEYISELTIYEIKNLCIEHGARYNEKEIIEPEKYVSLYIDACTKYDDYIKITFNKYIPYELAYLSSIFIIIFGSLPKILEGFLYELHALLTDDIAKYEFKNKVNFDLKNQSLSELFTESEINEARMIVQNCQVPFLEKIDRKYYSVVNTNKKYLVVIENFNEYEQEYKFYCSCPQEGNCEHICAVIQSIRAKNFNNFYKIIFKNNDNELLEKIMNFNYFLCIGVDGKNIEIVDNYGELTKVPIMGLDGFLSWEILEDSEDQVLTKEFNKYCKREE